MEVPITDAAVQLPDLEGPRVIVTDVSLPERLNGIHATFTDRQMNSSIPVIFISGTPAKLEKARALGNPFAFLQIPFSLGRRRSK